ncbi:MAG TPA: tetratricopeptide repeat protein, partial [Flavobacteriales bacterium]|nr:tetratricopeptide repeat protein [Flavobacteriales bacterium]
LQTKKYTEAIDFFKTAVTYLKNGNPKTLSSSLNNMANCYLYLGDYKRSIGIRKEVIALRKKNNFISGLGDSYNDLGETYGKMNRPDSAIFYLEKAYSLKKEIGDDEMCAVSTLNLGMVHLLQGRHDKALEFLTLANHYSLKIKSLPYRLEVWKNMLQVYKARNDKEKQLDLLYKIISLNDSVYNEENQRQVNQLHIEFQTEKKELAYKALQAKNLQQKKLTQAENARKKTILWFSVAGGSLLLLFLLIVLNRFKLTRLQKNQIEQKNRHLEEMRTELERLSIVASETENVVLIMDQDGTLEWVNTSFEKLNAITLDELKKLKGNTIFEISNNPNIKQIVEECIREKKSYQYESLNYTRNGKRYWESSTLTPIFNEDGNLRKLIIIDTDVTQQKDAEELVREKQKEILDSINYAKRLQEAILPPIDFIYTHLPESFVLYKPKDIVAGDFYFMEVVDDVVIVAAADSTGHGVPGAMVSVVCSNALHRSVNEFGLTDPGNILGKTRELVIQTFEKSTSEVKDGMDISLCAIKKNSDNNSVNVSWAGANNPLWYFKNNQMHEITATKQPIGKSYEMLPFTTHHIEMTKGDCIYLFTDGFADQFGGEKGKKFKYSNLQKLLIEKSVLQPARAHAELDTVFEAWKGPLEQVDDVCIIGIKL